MTIGQISELTAYSQRMIRFLEEEDFISPKRTDSNIRLFNDEDLKKILEVKRFKELGFTYTEIKQLVLKEKKEIVPYGIKLLERHHQASEELYEKIRRLEVLCYGESTALGKSNLNRLPARVAYNIPALTKISSQMKKELNLTSDITFMKFSDFQEKNTITNFCEFELTEIFCRSSQLAVLIGSSFLPSYTDAFSKINISLAPYPIGKFEIQDLGEFFSRSDIIMEQRLTDKDGNLQFLAILPYQAIFIASKKLDI